MIAKEEQFDKILKYNQSRGAYLTQLHLKGKIKDCSGQLYTVDDVFYLNNYGNEIYSLISRNGVDFTAKRRDILPIVTCIYNGDINRWLPKKQIIYTDFEGQDGNILDGCIWAAIAIGICSIFMHGIFFIILIIGILSFFVTNKYN